MRDLKATKNCKTVQYTDENVPTTNASFVLSALRNKLTLLLNYFCLYFTKLLHPLAASKVSVFPLNIYALVIKPITSITFDKSIRKMSANATALRAPFSQTH